MMYLQVLLLTGHLCDNLIEQTVHNSGVRTLPKCIEQSLQRESARASSGRSFPSGKSPSPRTWNLGIYRRMHTRVGFHGKDRRPTHLESRIDPMIAMMSKAVTEKMDGPCAMVSK